MKALVFLGSRRQSSPPRPQRVGERVCAFLMAQMGLRFETTLVDPLDYEPTEIFKPSFAYAADKKPLALATLEQLIREADAYVMVSPEYNHSMSPALADMLNHFASSAFSFKPSLIATYSTGQWGGARAAVSMRTFLSELGCVPVSAMLHFAHADQVFQPNGLVNSDQDEAQWLKFASRGVEQLHWWATAAANHRKVVNPFELSPAFVQSPKGRDSPEA